MGAFARPAYYMEIRQDLHDDLISSLDVINEEYKKYNKIFSNFSTKNKKSLIDNGLIEYYGPKNPKTILVAMGSVVGTVKEYVDNNKTLLGDKVGVLKIKTYRPFPNKEILKAIKNARYVAVLDKSISLGNIGPLASDIKSASQGKIKAKIQSFIVGLGGRDITAKMIKKIITEVKNNIEDTKFIG